MRRAGGGSDRWGVRVFRWVLRTVTPGNRAWTVDEATTAFAEAYQHRLERGRIRAWAYLCASLLDAALSGLRPPIDVGRGTPSASRGRGAGSGDLSRDLLYAGRRLATSPGFTATAVAVLALGIGANAAVFSAVRAVLLAPPPYPEADRVVFPKISRVRPGAQDTIAMSWSMPKALRLIEGTTDVFSAVGVYGARSVALSAPGTPERIEVEVVDPGYFRVLAVEPRMGRLFRPEEAVPGDPRHIALLSHGEWVGRFGGDPGVVGRSLLLGGERLTVVGVLPAGFRGLSGGARVWIPVADAEAVVARCAVRCTQAHWAHTIARLAPGVTFADGQRRIRVVGDAIEAEFPLAESGGGWAGAELWPSDRIYRNDAARASVAALSGAAALVLLIAVTNLAGLLIARSARRRRETAVRRALGGSRWRVARPVLAETLLLAVLGASTGLAVARWGTDLMAGAWPDTFVHSAGGELRVIDVASVGLDLRVVAFAFGVAAMVGLVFAVLPTFTGESRDLSRSLGGRSPSSLGAGLGTRATRRLLVTAQTGIAVVLLVGAGLMLDSLARLQAVPRGYESGPALVFRYEIPPDLMESDVRWDLHRSLLERLRAMPAVTGAAIGSTVPQGGHSSVTSVEAAQGLPPIGEEARVPIGVHEIAPGWFETLGIPVSEGRSLDETDSRYPPSVAVISRTAARQVFGDVSPVGRWIQIGWSYGDEHGGRFRVVGVAEDVLFRRPDDGVMADLYMPLAASRGGGAAVLARTTGEPLALVPAVRRAVAELAPTLPIADVSTLHQIEARSMGDTRGLFSMLGVFAALALALAATGLYGVIAVSLAERRRELGLRMALGARAGEVVRMLLGQGLSTAALGALMGLAIAASASGALEGLLYDVGPRAPLPYVASATALLAVALIATWLPARRATSLDPSESLREE